MREWMDDALDVTLYVTRHVKAARKEFACGACGDRIQRGFPYDRSCSVVDGEFATSRVHAPMCPRDIDAYEQQFRKDQQWLSPAPSTEEPPREAAPSRVAVTQLRDEP